MKTPLRSVPIWRAAGAALAAAGMALSALAAHFPENRLAPGGRTMLHSAAEVMVWHALALLLAGLVPARPSRAILLGVWGLLAGTLLFASGVCLTAFTGIHPGPVAPSGGSLLILSWLFLAIALPLWKTGQD
ncbi:DUF423 domain-containing protein [Acetobacter sp. AN02]|uniref:DUF423 domain-containing protein n=1 Tax=Acetobacter sp. AN02 TaxID=2894186 RepID=UPI0024345B54|nr:DUF423 domain-containing protein [Acetobacter sp. AN02]MDG6095432.1 DUF423 domain-containing protein [Acetobacter sp. AN02]